MTLDLGQCSFTRRRRVVTPFGDGGQRGADQWVFQFVYRHAGGLSVFRHERQLRFRRCHDPALGVHYEGHAVLADRQAPQPFGDQVQLDVYRSDAERDTLFVANWSSQGNHRSLRGVIKIDRRP